MAISGPKHKAQSYIEGLDILANMRLCANVPSQHAIQTALGGYQSINDLVLPPGRLLEQRNRTWELLNDIPGISCVKPMGALYAFPRIDPKICPIHNDEKFVLDLLLSEKLLIVQGTAFNWPWPDHFRWLPCRAWMTWSRRSDASATSSRPTSSNRMDLQIDDFYKDAAGGLLALYQAFPRKIALYVEDLIGREEPDEFGLPSKRAAWAPCSGWPTKAICASSTIQFLALDQAVLTEKGFIRLTRAVPGYLAGDRSLPPSVLRIQASLAHQLRDALKSGHSERIAHLARLLFENDTGSPLHSSLGAQAT